MNENEREHVEPKCAISKTSSTIIRYLKLSINYLLNICRYLKYFQVFYTTHYIFSLNSFNFNHDFYLIFKNVQIF